MRLGGMPGTLIGEASHGAVHAARATGETIMATFGGVEIFVSPEDDPREVERTWTRELEARARAEAERDTLRPRDGWVHVGCPDCGMVTTVPLTRMEPPPWCVHSGTTIVWNDPNPAPGCVARPWTRTVRVVVRRAEERAS